MIRMVYCVKLGREAEGLKFSPYPGDLGQRVYQHVSADAWKLWLRQQTMFINEYRLSAIDPQARKFLEGEMEKFFFGEGSNPPEDFVSPQN